MAPGPFHSRRGPVSHRPSCNPLCHYGRLASQYLPETLLPFILGTGTQHSIPIYPLPVHAPQGDEEENSLSSVHHGGTSKTSAHCAFHRPNNPAL